MADPIAPETAPEPPAPIIAGPAPLGPVPAPEAPADHAQPPAGLNGHVPADQQAARYLEIHDSLGALQAQLDQIEQRQRIDGQTLIALMAVVCLAGALAYMAIKQGRAAA